MRDLFIKDWGWKLFSLLLAAAIWLTVHRILQESIIPTAASGSSTLTYGNLPVMLVSASVDVGGYRLLKSTVSVTVTGSPEVIGKLQANQVHASVNLAGSNTVNTVKQHVDVSVPVGVTVIDIFPESLGVLAPVPKH